MVGHLDTIESLATTLQALGITSKKKAKQYIRENNLWNCIKCARVCNSESELISHLKKKASHRANLNEIKKYKMRFHQLLGHEGDFLPIGKYIKEYREDFTPELQTMYYRIIAQDAVLVHTKRRGTQRG